MMWQPAGGSESWPVPVERHRRSRRGARPIASLLSTSGFAPQRSLPNVRRCKPLPKIDSPPPSVARRKAPPSPAARLSPLWYSSPPTSAPSSPSIRPEPKTNVRSLLMVSTRVRSPSRVSVHYQTGALTRPPRRRLVPEPEPQAALQPPASPARSEPEPEPEAIVEPAPEPEPEPEPDPEAQAQKREKARRFGQLKATLQVRSTCASRPL